MGQILPDGTVIPYGLAIEDVPDPLSYSDRVGEHQCMVGEVREIVYPDDEKSVGKRQLEYSVFVQYRIDGIGTGRMFTGCTVMNPLASKADFSYHTLRVNNKAGNDVKANPPGLGLGSKVVILCPNGDVAYPLIIGGLYDPTDNTQKDIPKGDDGIPKRLYHAQFNGIHFDINDDGELQVTYKGATNERDETDVEDSVSGAFIKFFKNGNISIQDSDGKNQVLIDHENKKVVIKRDEKLEIGAATDKMLLGQTFRKEQKALHDKLASYHKTLNQLTQQAGTAALTAGTKQNVIIYGAVAAAADLVQLGSLLTSIAQIHGQIEQAIREFEAKGGSGSYCSSRNLSD